MHNRFSQPLLFVLAAVTAVIAGLLATILSPVLVAFAVAGIAFVVLFSINLRVALLVLLVARSNIDAVHGLQIASSDDLNLNAAAIVGVVLVILGIFYILANNVNVFRSPVNIPYAIFLAVCLAGLVVSAYPTEVLTNWMRAASMLIFYVLAIEAFRTHEDIGKLVIAYFMSSVLPVLLGLYQFVTGQGVYVSGFYRVYGTFVVPPAFAFYLVGLLPLTVVVLIHTQNKFIKALVAGWLVLMSFDLVVTYTRGAWIGICIALGVLALCRYRKLLVLLPIIALVAISTFPQITERWADLNEERSTTGYGEANTFAWRTKFWLDTMLAGAEKSPMVGSGLGTIKRIYYADPHNDYLRLYIETGVLGFAAYAAVLGLLFVRALLAYRRATSRFYKDVSLAFVAVLLAYIVMSTADNIILGPVMQWYLWAQAAIVQVILESSPYQSRDPVKEVKIVVERSTGGSNGGLIRKWS